MKIRKLTSPNTAVLNTTVNVGEDVELPFEVTDGWGEYKLTMTRPTASDAITVSNIAIYQTREAEEAGLIEIPQENVETSFTKADKVEGADYTTYTTKEGEAGQLNIAIKTLNVNVEDCDYVVIKFAEAVPSGWCVAFWEDQTTEAVPEGATEFKLVFSEDTHKDKGVKNGVLPQITLMIMWDYGPKIAKVKGIYKHRVRPASVSINSLVKIPQENVETGFPAATAVVGPDYTTYTATGNLQFAIKTLNVDVAGCDYVVMKFAEPVPSGWCVAFWEDQTNEMIPAGSTEYKLIFAEDSHKDIGVKDGVLPQLTLMTRPWGEDVGTVSIKVSGVYKHIASDYSRTFSFDNALDFTEVEGLAAYVITAFNPATATLTLTKVNQVPANTGLYLVGKGGDYDVPALISADAIATNLLHASSGTDELSPTEGDYTNLIFGGTGANRGFHPLSKAGVIGANKAYLQLPTAQFNSIPSNARLNLVFEDEMTGVRAVSETNVADGAWYTLSGVKLSAKPSRKGIYIHNGRKYAIQ